MCRESPNLVHPVIRAWICRGGRFFLRARIPLGASGGRTARNHLARRQFARACQDRAILGQHDDGQSLWFAAWRGLQDLHTQFPAAIADSRSASKADSVMGGTASMAGGVASCFPARAACRAWSRNWSTAACSLATSTCTAPVHARYSVTSSATTARSPRAISAARGTRSFLARRSALESNPSSTVTLIVLEPPPTRGRPRLRLARLSRARCLAVGEPNESPTNSRSKSAVASRNSLVVISQQGLASGSAPVAWRHPFFWTFSWFSPSFAFLLTVRQRPRVDYVGGILGIKYEYCLQPPAAVPPPYRSPFVILARLRVRRTGMLNDRLGFFWGDAVLGNMLDIPIVPSKKHACSPCNILPYRKILASSNNCRINSARNQSSVPTPPFPALSPTVPAALCRPRCLRPGPRS